MVKLQGSCHCGAVRFSLVSHTPYPYNRCYCTICRKTAGGGGYAINIMGEAATHRVEGEDQVNVYRVRRGGDTVAAAAGNGAELRRSRRSRRAHRVGRQCSSY